MKYELMDKISTDRLHEDIVYGINQFQTYANLPAIDRNITVVRILEKIIEDAKKMQIEECKYF